MRIDDGRNRRSSDQPHPIPAEDEGGRRTTHAAAPETLLLDEPTGHLDPAATGWLEDRLRAHRGTVLVVSHDRLFLERVATAI